MGISRFSLVTFSEAERAYESLVGSIDSSLTCPFIVATLLVRQHNALFRRRIQTCDKKYMLETLSLEPEPFLRSSVSVVPEVVRTLLKRQWLAYAIKRQTNSDGFFEMDRRYRILSHFGTSAILPLIGDAIWLDYELHCISPPITLTRPEVLIGT